MRRFTQLFSELDVTTRTGEKLAALESYFREAPPTDAAWALFFLSGQRIKRAINTRLLRDWVALEANLPLWLVEESYDAVGDLAEAFALLLPEPAEEAVEQHNVALHQIVERYLLPLAKMEPVEQRELLREAWKLLDTPERLVFHKLMLGEFRVGVARTLVVKALARVAEVEPAIMAHRVMGQWQPTAMDYEHLLTGAGEHVDPGRPYPFYLAYPLEGEPADLGDRADWQAEWKWDGIRAQLIKRQDAVLVWSRGEELITDRFPEVLAVGSALPPGTVLDGEILAWRGDAPLAFAVLQKRIGRKKIDARVLANSPAAFMAYDLLEWQGDDVRSWPLVERRAQLEKIVASLSPLRPVHISPLVETADWAELVEQQRQARALGVEGLMLKRRAAPYGVGRVKGDWWKWKIDPLSIDAVLINAQRGHGRRASLYTDYTFGVWDGPKLVPIAKAYSGLTDAEIREVDAFVRHNTLEKFGPVRAVKPELVFELHFEGIQISTRHKAGLAVRFPRMHRWRRDKPAAEADSLDTLRSLLKLHPAGAQP